MTVGIRSKQLGLPFLDKSQIWGRLQRCSYTLTGWIPSSQLVSITLKARSIVQITVGYLIEYLDHAPIRKQREEFATIRGQKSYLAIFCSLIRIKIRRRCIVAQSSLHWNCGSCCLQSIRIGGLGSRDQLECVSGANTQFQLSAKNPKSKGSQSFSIALRHAESKPINKAALIVFEPPVEA
ncbi:unnamed protein product [Albugo candida]|uniref:Uncharacterized protein n=1 Tax=Albugo candida TaxID=65357 RepID=A0A024GHT4_9STRA|nr:unnamed protein product [Albugo candida]|eukprot:CCI46418.1 unnamed protein product [Albugo candida]